MKFIDPFPTTCDRCPAKSPQRVADLLSLAAFCPSCGASLAEVGRKMRAIIDEAAAFFKLVDIVLELEEKLGIAMSDAELAGVKTLKQLADVVQRRLPANSEAEVRLLEIVTAAASRAPSQTAEELSLDAPATGKACGISEVIEFLPPSQE